MTQSSLRSNATKGSLSGVLQVVIATALVVVTIPLFIKRLGQEAWGVFSIVTVVGTANSFTNLGLNAALVRFLAGQGKTRESDHDILVTLLLLIAMSVPLAIVGFAFESTFVVHLLNIPAGMMEEGVWLYRSMLVCNVLVLVGQTFTAVLDAQQRVHWSNVCQMINAILYWGLILLVILMQWPLRVMGITILGATVVWFFVAGGMMLSTWGWPSTVGIRADFTRLARKQLTYGLQLFSAGLIGFFYEPLAKLLVANFLGMREVGLFEVGLRARNLIGSAAGKLLYPLYPLLSSKTDPAAARNIVRNVEQKALLFATPLVGVTILCALPLANIFFEKDTALLATTIVWMVTTYMLLSISVTPFYTFLMARGYAAVTVIVQLSNVIVNAAVFFLMLATMGYYAAISANVAAYVISWGILCWYHWKYLGTMMFDDPRLLLVVFLGIALPACVHLLVPLGSAGVGGVVLLVLGVGALNIILCRLSGVITSTDISLYLGDSSAASRICKSIFCRMEHALQTKAGGS
jgi:O-antigen/teichoic acid export membrane protein